MSFTNFMPIITAFDFYIIIPQPNISKLDNLPSVDIVRGLGVEGELIAAFRGKELVFGIEKVLYLYSYIYPELIFFFFEFLFRVCYALEGHSFWVPTAQYDTIVLSPPVNRGEKSKTYNIPPNIWGGLPSVQGQISIQAAFRCPDWTLLFVDHNVMITFHVMALRKPCTRQDLMPGSIVSTRYSIFIQHEYNYCMV